ncbi:MAG: response regulator [Ignavibacteriales bacterium]|nr:response regulator [Ignavibacteriales bacterium]
MSDKPVVLVIDDEIQIRRLLELTLKSNGYKVLLADTAQEGVRQAEMDRPELTILDLGLPDMDGLNVLKKIRQWSSMPVLILSVRDSESDIVACLDAGADDYLVKPFRTGELLARVRTALRHRPGQPIGDLFECHGLSVDLAARTVKKFGIIVKLTATEYSLLALLIRHAGKVLTHRFILQEIWGPAHADETQYTRVYVGQLRKKIENDPTNPNIILTESGIGYRLGVDE